MELYGILPKDLVCETFDGDRCIVNLDGNNDQNSSYEKLPTISQSDVKRILHVCDNSMISDNAYHERSMYIPEMPRKHLLLSCRNETSNQYDIKRTPGMLPGAYLSLSANLLVTLK